MFTAYKNYWLNYSEFTGRSSRSDFWWVVLCQFLVTLPFTLLLFLALVPGLYQLGLKTQDYPYEPTGEDFFIVFSPFVIIIFVLLLLFFLATIVPNLALIVRRLRDAGFHWAFAFLLAPSYLVFIPFIILLSFPCSVALIVLLCMPTKRQYAFGQPGPYDAQPQGEFYHQTPQEQTNPMQQPPVPPQYAQAPQKPSMPAYSENKQPSELQTEDDEAEHSENPMP